MAPKHHKGDEAAGGVDQAAWGDKAVRDAAPAQAPVVQDVVQAPARDAVPAQARGAVPVPAQDDNPPLGNCRC